MDRIVIIGTTPFSEIVYRTIREEAAAEVLAFAVSRDYVKFDKFLDLPVFALEELQNIYAPDSIFVLNTIGYNSMNEIRENLAKVICALGYKEYSFISKRSYVSDSALVGEGCIVMPCSNVGHNVKIGHGVILYNSVCLTHDIYVGDFSFICSGTVVGGFARVAHHCFLGLNSTISTGVCVAPYTLVGASTFINKNTEAYAVYSIPASMSRENKTAMNMIEKICV